jgi:hypothetical protein
MYESHQVLLNWRMPFCNRCDSNHLTLITKKIRLSLKILIVFLNHFQLQKWLHTGNYYFEFILKIASSFWFSLFVLQNKNRKSKPNFYFLVLVLKRKKQQKGNVSSSDIGRMTKRASICLRKALYTGINPCTISGIKQIRQHTHRPTVETSQIFDVEWQWPLEVHFGAKSALFLNWALCALFLRYLISFCFHYIEEAWHLLEEWHFIETLWF